MLYVIGECVLVSFFSAIGAVLGIAFSVCIFIIILSCRGRIRTESHVEYQRENQKEQRGNY